MRGKGGELCHELDGGSFSLRMVAKAIQPVDILFFAKPSHLALCVLTRFELQVVYGFRPAQRAVQNGDRLPVAEGLKRLGAGGNAAIQEGACFFQQSGFKHCGGAQIDPFIEGGTRGIETYFQDSEAGQRFAGLRRGGGQFNGATELLVIVGVDALRGPGIRPAKETV